MPLQKIQLRPGINREGTNYSNEGGYYECDKVRFRSGYPEKLGGWIRLSSNTFKGVCKTMWNWVSLSGYNLNAVGTNQKYYIESGGVYNDITPLTAASPVALAANPFATTSGSLLVTVTAAAHGATAGTFVTFAGASAVGGLTLNGEYEIVLVVDTNTYQIIASSTASSTATGGGAAVTATYQINAGLASFVGGTGWGAGSWGRGGWGSGVAITAGLQLRLWSQDNFGQDLVFAPRGGPLYYWVNDTTTWARAILLSSAATTAGYVGADVPVQTNQVIASDVQRFVICLGANPYGTTTTADFNPMLVRWSDQENVYDWTPTSTNQSGEQPLQNGSYLVCGRITRQEILIWSDSALYSMQYLGPPYVWGFQLLMDNISIISPNCAITVNNITYWMGCDKFYQYSGRVETLPCSLRQFVYSDLNQDQAWQIVCGTNEGYNEVWWHYPSSESLVNDRYVIYNYLERVWYYGTLNRTAWLDSPLRQYPMGVISIQTSYLNNAIDSSTTTLSLLNASSYPDVGTVVIDSETITYTGNDGSNLTGCTRGALGSTAASHIAYSTVSPYASNGILYHEYGLDDASTGTNVAIASYVGSSDFDIGDGHNYGFVWRMIPDVNFTSSTSNAPYITLTVKPRTFPGAPYGYGAAPTVTRTATIPVEQYTQEVYTRIRGRQMSMRIDSNDLGVAWQLGVPRIDIRPDGRKT